MIPSTKNGGQIVMMGKVEQKLPRFGLPADYSGLPGTSCLYHNISQAVHEEIEAHAQANRQIEVGGILLGEVYWDREGEIYLVSVTNILPARHTDSGAIYLTFTGQTWLDIIARRMRYPNKKTVGWYHSHPDLGIFLSAYDRFIHRSFFGDQPWYITLVIDPISGDRGVFVWDGDQIVRGSDLAVHP